MKAFHPILRLRRVSRLLLVVLAGASRRASALGGPGDDIPKLENPLKGINDLESFIAAVLSTAAKVAVPVAALIFIWSGFLYIKAYGKPAELSKVHKIIGFTALGLGLILAAPLVARVLQTTVDALQA